MHPYCQRSVGDGGIEALLQEQAVALGGAPSVSVKRTKPKEEKLPVAKPSLFKQQRQGKTTETHPELHALEGALAEGEENPPCLKEVCERQEPSQRREAGFAAPESGFPVPLHRAVGKSLGTSLKKKSQEVDKQPEDEDEAIDMENRKTLMNASPEEVKEWQQQLLQSLGAETCERLRKRGQRKAKEAKVAAKVAVEKVVDKEDEKKPTEEKEKVLAPPTVSLEMAGEGLGVLDRSELQKLQWTTPAGEPDFDKVLADASLPPEPCGRALQLIRFDFDGRICLRGEEFEDSDGLHHHGAESSQAGYTLAELLLLSRSSSAAQRLGALQVLGEVLKRARIPAPQDVLSRDLAIGRSGLFEGTQPGSVTALPWRAGFGLGLQVFFWHVLARSDVPKHLAEGLADPAQPVQLAALRATVELLDGVAGAEVPGDVLRGRSQGRDACHSVIEAALSRPWDASRSLLWPSAPVAKAEDLARGTVAVLAAEGFGGHGGGQSAWPPLLKRQLLGAKEEPEVTAIEVLEPLLPLGEMPSLGRFLPPTSDDKQLALLARALASALVLKPEVCARLLREDHRSLWISSAELSSPETRREVLRFIRMSCEVVGRGAVAWWLREEGSKLVALLRRSVLTPLKGGSSDLEVLCAVEAVRCWILFLRCGAGCDRLESFAAEIGTYWHRFTVQDLDEDVMEGHFLLTGHLLELTLELLRLRGRGPAAEEPVAPLQMQHEGVFSAVSSAFCAASTLLAERLSSVESASAAQQLCLANFADVLDVALSAAIASHRHQGSSPMLPAQQLMAAQRAADVPQVEVLGDENAPWPLGGALGPTSSALGALARLRALGALARLGGKVEGCEEWLQALWRNAREAVQRRAPKLPVPCETEALIGDVTGDPLSALLIDVCLSCEAALSSEDFAQALALSGSWPTAQALFRHAGLNFQDAEDAVVRAAFQPHAVWSGDVPEALGPPVLAFASAPWWALATSSGEQLQNLLLPLVREESTALCTAAPPWLPFVAFASVLGHAQEAWRDTSCRELLERYADRHLRSSPSWKGFVSQEWFSELMRGLCDRLAKVFLEESFMDTLLASTLWSFSASFMPPACRAVCWGEDVTLLRFLDRALLCDSSSLLWSLEDYAAPEDAAKKLDHENPRTWPRAIAARSAAGPRERQTADLDSLE